MSHRAEQLAEIIKQELNNFLIRDAEPPRDALVTITRVEVSSDLDHAMVSLSILPINKTGTLMSFMNRIKSPAGRYLAKHTIIRKVPQLHFKIDDTAIKHRKVERALEEDED